MSYKKATKHISDNLSMILKRILVIMLIFASVGATATDEQQVARNEEDRGGLNIIKLEDGTEYEAIEGGGSRSDKLRQIKTDSLNAQSIHSDVKGWIWLDDHTYEPLTYSPDDWYKFFHHNLYGDYDFAGIPFMSPESGGNLDGNTILYAHNMINGTAFGGLKPLKHPDRFANAPKLVIYWIDNDVYYEFDLYTVMKRADGVDPKIQEINFSSEQERIEYNKGLMNLNTTKSDLTTNDLDFEQRTVFLQHCDEVLRGANRVTFGFTQSGEFTSDEIIDNLFDSLGFIFDIEVELNT